MSGVNRVVLGIVGLVLLLAGVLVGLISAGRLDIVLRQLGTARRQPPAEAPILPAGLTDGASTVVLAIVAASAVVLAGLSVWWLVRQFPRTARTPDFRLQSDVSRGSTVVTPATLSAAIGGQLEQLSGVLKAAAVVRGAVQAPQLLVRVTVDDRCDVAGVVAAISSEVGGGLATALGSTVDSLQVLIDVGHRDRTDTTAVL